jgi:hypothetical protein
MGGATWWRRYCQVRSCELSRGGGNGLHRS